MTRAVPIGFDPLNGDQAARVYSSFGYSDGLGMVTTNPGGFMMTAGFAEKATELYNFPVDKNDVWIVTFPKAGTNWVSEMAWLIGNDLDYSGAKKSLDMRVRLFEKVHQGMICSLERTRLNSLKPPRYIKTHLPFYLLPPKLLDTSKVIYVARNPKDVVVSWYYHHKLTKYLGFNGNLDEFIDFFIKDEVMYSPYWPHVLEAWKFRHHPNMLFVFYEDLKENLPNELQRIANHLGKDLLDEEIETLHEHLTFDNFKINPAVNKEEGKERGVLNKSGSFIRNGKVGDWQYQFTPEMNEKIERWIACNTEDTDLEFTYTLDYQD